LFSILLLSVLWIDHAAAVNIECKYFMFSFGSNVVVYQCETQNLYVTESTVVSRVFGNHANDKNNLDVEHLHIKDQTCYYMPRGFETFFPNLRGIRIASTQLKTIASIDLKPFPRLIALDVPFNDITTIESGIFEFNTKLNYVYLGRNKITTVGRNVLAPLKASDLRVWFDLNICTGASGENPTAIKVLQGILNSNCGSSEITNCN
jgi:hypothetical protein